MAQGPLSIAQMLEKTSFATGSVWQMFEAARGLVERGHRVVVVTRPDDRMATRCAQAGIDFVGMALRHEFDLGSMRRLARLARDRNLDVVHVHKGIPHAIALGASYLGTRYALVVNRGVSFPLALGSRIKYRSARVQRVVTVCEHIRQVVISSGKLPPDKVEVVYAGVDLTRFDPDRCDGSKVRNELAIDAEAHLVGHVGMRDWKGWKELLRAFPAVRERHPGAHLLLVGCSSDRQRQAVQETAAEMGLGDHVSVTLARADMPDVLCACDIVVDPSWAGTGITGTIREAMALAKPVVATSVAGNPELVEHGSSGLLIEPRDVPSLAAAIGRLLDEPSFAERLGRNAQRRVRKRFSTDVRISRLEKVYARALRDRRRAQRA